jgi:hypothetical protein
MKKKRKQTPTRGDLEAVADLALLRGEIVLWAGYALVPDVAVVEGAANGLPPLPPTFRLERDDGRRVLVFADPNCRKAS